MNPPPLRDMTLPTSGGSGARLGHLVIILAGVSALVASLMTVGTVWLQSKNYRKPLLQRYVIRIMIMVPTFCISSWISLISLQISFWVEPFRDIYEAFTIYAFFQLLINFLGGERSLIIHMHGRKPVSHLWPLNYCMSKVDISDPHTFLAVKRGILQYTWVKPVLAFATIIMKATDTFQEGYIGVTSGYFWSSLIYNISIFVCLYALALFWVCMSEDLQPFRPMPKFICIKGIIFASWWQGFFLSILVFLGAIPDVVGYTPDNLATAIQNALICFEMPFFAALHLYAFSWKDYADVTISAARMPVKYALRDAFGPVDLIQDAKETFSGNQYEYRKFDADDNTLAHEESAQRQARIREGMRYERNGKGKYWIPDPHEATAKTPLLGKLTGEVRVVRSRSSSRSQESGGYGATPKSTFEDISLDNDDETLYENARTLEFGDWNYPVITAHQATREDHLYANPNMITASTNRHLLQGTKANRKRRKSAIREVQEHAEKGKHRSSASSADDEHDDDDAGSTSSKRGRSRLSHIPLVGGAIESVEERVKEVVHNHMHDDSRKADPSLLVDLVVEDKEAEKIERVRARKEGSPGWNRHEAKHFVRIDPEEEKAEEEVREGYESDHLDEHGTRSPSHQHALNEDFAIDSDEDEERMERTRTERSEEFKHKQYDVEPDQDEDADHQDSKGKGKQVAYNSEEDNVWAR